MKTTANNEDYIKIYTASISNSRPAVDASRFGLNMLMALSLSSLVVGCSELLLMIGVGAVDDDTSTMTTAGLELGGSTGLLTSVGAPITGLELFGAAAAVGMVVVLVEGAFVAKTSTGLAFGEATGEATVVGTLVLEIVVMVGVLVRSSMKVPEAEGDAVVRVGTNVVVPDELLLLIMVGDLVVSS